MVVVALKDGSLVFFDPLGPGNGRQVDGDVGQHVVQVAVFGLDWMNSAAELERMMTDDIRRQRARDQAMHALDRGLHLGGGRPDRESLHER